MNAFDLGLHEIELIAFDSITSWLKQHTGIAILSHAIMHCLLCVDTTTYFTKRQCLGKPIRKVLLRVLEARNLFVNIQRCDLALKAEDMFTSDMCNVLYPITASGIKAESPASEDSWAYNSVINGLVCPMTREPIIGFARGQPFYKTRSDSKISFEDLKVPQLFKMQAAAALILYESISEEFVLLEWPFDFLETLDFERAYGIPLDRCFSRIYLQNLPGIMPLAHLLTDDY